ncbi:MAG TPA: hypothetical protein VIJ75_21955 [Hanamia sp.]
MKKSYRPLAYLVLLVIIFILLPDLIHAGGGPGDPGGGDGGIPNPNCPPDDICPIDSGLVALIAVGVGYGIKKIWYNKKAESIS